MQKAKKPKPEKPAAHESVAQVFGMTRDIEVANPYHMDGNIDMYNEQNMSVRQKLSKDEDIRKQISEIVKLYQFDSDNKLGQDGYIKVQRELALILRPDIDKEELEFVVGQDWELDQKDGAIQKEDLIDKLFQLIDVWSIGADKQEYISFSKLLKKKLKRALDAKK